MKVQRGISQDSLDGSSQDSLDATAAESMALIIPQMHLLLNLRHFVPPSQIIIILSYLANSLHDFLSIKNLL